MRFKFLEHTADIKFQCYGSNLNQAFESAGLAFFESITDTKKIKKTIHKSIKLKSQDLKSLLYDFLEELLFLHETKRLVFSEFKIKVNEKKSSLTADLWGEKLKPRHEIKNVIKAVTYNDMIIEQNKKVMIQVVLDI
jgi:SHS2 domain-containing protein